MRTKNKLKPPSLTLFSISLLQAHREEGNGGCGQSITHVCCSLMVTLCTCSNVGSPSQDSVLPKLTTHGLPIGCSSPSTALTCLHTTGPILQALLQHRSPQAAAPPALVPHCGLLSMGCCPQSIPSSAHVSALAAIGAFWSSWSWLSSNMGQCWAAHRGHSAGPCYQNLARQAHCQGI